jgi:phospholipase/lecithinase/hemolysin
VLILVTAVTSTASAQSLTRLVSFGDSLSDVGNVNGATFGISPGSSYFSGRFSNGNVWTERLSSRLQLGNTQTPSRSGGRNYAYGGVRTGSGSTNFFGIFNFPNAGAQIEQFLSGNAPTPTDLFTLFIGGNDFIDGQTDVSIPANNVQAHLQRLGQAGAKQVLVANLPPLGELPRYVGNATNRTAFNTRSRAYNDALDARLVAVRAQYPATTFRLLDAEAFFDEVLAAPAAFGFTNVTQPALVGSTVVPNPDSYAFYDDIHPTRRAHSLLGDRAFRTATARPGDANLDTFVNFDDLLVLASAYNRPTGQRWRHGDFTGDGAVNFDDLLQLASNYNTPPAGGFAYALAIPEPTSVALCTAFAGSLRRRRR